MSITTPQDAHKRLVLQVEHFRVQCDTKVKALLVGFWKQSSLLLFILLDQK